MTILSPMPSPAAAQATVATLATLIVFAAAPAESAGPTKERPMSLHELSANTIELKPQPLSAYKGRVLLVVNTASECGNTPQYAGLEKLHHVYKDKGFAVLGFPSNDFGGQEPGSEAEIKKFCSLQYKVTFPMFAKVKTKGDGKVAGLCLPDHQPWRAQVELSQVPGRQGRPGHPRLPGQDAAR